MADTVFDATRGGLDSLASAAAGPRTLHALTVLWCREQPQRVGEVLLIAPGPERVFGRAGEEAPERLRFLRQRPGENQDRGELEAPRVSHEQLRLQVRRGSLELRSTGRLGLRVNGQARETTQLQPGDLVELDRQLLLLVELRPETLPALPGRFRFGQPDGDGLVGESVAAWTLRAQLRACAATTGHVLIQGESGAGKELVAQAIHRASGAQGPLVARNAASFPEGLLDAELFGNRRNYPNAGMPERSGAVGEANGGTLFLDEIGEVSHAMQAHLLRVLDAGEYQRLGEDQARTSRFRAVGATNRSLDSLKHDFQARFARRLAVPGLNERRADVPLLAEHLLRQIDAGNPGLFPQGAPRLHPRLATGLVLRRYSTHVRELQQLLWQAIEAWQATGQGKYLDLELEPALPEAPAELRDPGELSREDILEAYRRFGGVQARVPEFLGLKDRFQLLRLEKKLGITKADKDGVG
ncbi:MAG: sigma-54-dependent Fis family transcriptional regulator [Alphaproteobacteria bacterium]|nr:sigma-54-dependent Fis family transcriptional regulator [Alphaproteobacteria bacterium]MCB9794778.1 sigma-54-dependent Fis family transcriptional regulator [Alphaproteobacteria bacterium]